MRAIRELTVTEIARLLGVRQHRLIHLVEKGAVPPDIADARGRGASRRFSHRNLLEFAIALRLRDALIPVAAVAAVIQVLRMFERKVEKAIPEFALPSSIQSESAPELRIVLSDGQRLFFTLGTSGKVPKVFDGGDLRSLKLERGKVRGVPRDLTERSNAAGDVGVGGPEGSRHIRVEVSVTQIAKDLPRI